MPETIEIEPEDSKWNNWPITIRKCLAEFVGDVIFVFIGSLSTAPTETGGGVLLPAMAHGMTIALLVMSLGHISGAHFNPAVTLSVFISGNINAVLVPLYWISQLSGAFVGALLVRAVSSAQIQIDGDGMTEPLYCLIGGGITDYTFAYVGNALVMEIMATFILTFTILNAAVHSNGKNVLAALAIGLALMVSICAGANISGASANPARSFGPLMAYSALYKNAGCLNDSVYYNGWNHSWIYIAGPVLGGTVSGLLYKAFFTHNSKRWMLKNKEQAYSY